MEKISITNQKLREFGIFIGISLPLLIGIILPLINGDSFRFYALFFGLPLIFLGIFKPMFLFYPYKVWILVGKILGWLNSRIILGMVFILILQPIAFAMKLFGYDPLKKRKNNDISYREKKLNHNTDLTRIF